MLKIEAGLVMLRDVYLLFQQLQASARQRAREQTTVAWIVFCTNSLTTVVAPVGWKLIMNAHLLFVNATSWPCNSLPCSPLCRAGWLQLCSLPRSSTATWWGWVCPSVPVTSRNRSRDRLDGGGGGGEWQRETQGTRCQRIVRPPSSSSRTKARKSVTVSEQHPDSPTHSDPPTHRWCEAATGHGRCCMLFSPKQ